MFQIHPRLDYSAHCPLDSTELYIKSVLMPGMRCLADAQCPKCQGEFLVDLPVGQALWLPTILDKKTGEIYDPLDIGWFSSLLQKSFLNPVEEKLEPIVHKFFDSDRIVIVNCLDFLYGHSLLKLLNVQRYLDHHPDLGCCVLVPTQLVHLVPEGVAEIWEVPVSIKQGWQWYSSLERWLSNQISARKECFLSPAYSHPHQKYYDLKRFTKELPDISDSIKDKSPVIVFSYREDRLWGRNLKCQTRNIQKLYEKLSAIFPNLVFVLVGFGDIKRATFQQKSASIIDLRVDKFSKETDQLWMSYMKAADCSVGVHGSNMLLPSGLSRAVVELVPRSRIGNTVQDFLFDADDNDNRDALLFKRMIYGDEFLRSIVPSSVVDLISCMVSYSKTNSAWFKVSEDIGQINERDFWHQNQLFKRAAKYLSSTTQEPMWKVKLIKAMHMISSWLD